MTLIKRKVSIFALTLLLVCMLSMALNMPLVQADRQGIGKYLTIEIEGEGSVNALKVKSGQFWVFEYEDPAQEEKVGAGTVKLTANAAVGWEFSRWEDAEGFTISLSEIMYYKSVKYAYLTAVFIVETFTITPSVVGNGAIEPNIPVTLEYGASQTFEFTPDAGNHISAINVTGEYQSIFATQYTFENIQQDHTIEVVFDLEGQATVPNVPEDETANVFLASTAVLTISGTGGGTAFGGEEVYALGAGAWEISIDFSIGESTATLTYDDTGLSEEDENNLILVKAETIFELRSDVNGDRVVNGDDVSDVANAVKKYPDWYDPVYDLNDDDRVDEFDLHIVNENKGAIIRPIPIIERNIGDNTITFSLECFSAFGCR